MLKEQVQANKLAEEQKDVIEFMQGLHMDNAEIRKNLLGRVLTVIDAVAIKDEQRKAVKDLIHSCFNDFHVNTNRLESEIVNLVSALKYGKGGIEQVDNPNEGRIPKFEMEEIARK